MDLPRYEADLFSDEAIVDPYPHYRRIRDLGAVVEYPLHECYLIARYDEVRRILREPDVFISGKGVFLSREMNEGKAANVLASDPPRHTFFRQIEGEPLTPQAVAQLAEHMSAQAEGLIARIVADGRPIDAIPTIARYLPLTVVTELIGLPEEGRERMLEWAAAGFELAGPLNARAQAALPVVGELVDYALNQVEPAKLRPGSWAERGFKLAAAGTIPPEMARAMIVDLIGPSLDTTILGIGGLLMLLGQNPDQWRLLKSDPTLVPNAINEALRLESPVRAFTRYVALATEIAGIPIPEGSRVLILYGSANRDERRWPESERFDIKRPNAGAHLAFGLGRHMCMGAHLARLEMRSVLEAMLARVDSFEIGPPVFALNNILRGLQSLPMTLR